MKRHFVSVTTTMAILYTATIGHSQVYRPVVLKVLLANLVTTRTNKRRYVVPDPEDGG